MNKEEKKETPILDSIAFIVMLLIMIISIYSFIKIIGMKDYKEQLEYNIESNRVDIIHMKGNIEYNRENVNKNIGNTERIKDLEQIKYGKEIDKGYDLIQRNIIDENCSYQSANTLYIIYQCVEEKQGDGIFGNESYTYIYEVKYKYDENILIINK